MGQCAGQTGVYLLRVVSWAPMCGIAGILSANPGLVSEQRVKNMTDAIAHRGPDGEAWWVAPEGQLAIGAPPLIHH